MSTGIHIVKKPAGGGKPVRWYVYAYRGGPQIHRSEGGPRPKITAALMDAASAARRSMNEARVGGGTIWALIEAYRSESTPEWKRLAASTKRNRNTWLNRIAEVFGSAPLQAFEDRRIRGQILEWRDQWADQARSADAAVSTFSNLLAWGLDRGKLSVNVAAGIAKLYDTDRSELIWEPRHFEAFFAVASVEVREGVELAAATGLRRGDLVALPWAAVGEHAIVWRTAKSRGKNLATVPLLPEAKELLARIKARHASEMAARPEAKRKPLPETVLANSYWRPWGAEGFGSRFNDAKKASGIEVHLHDLRGTFITRCMIAGLNDREIADIVGWDTKDIASIRARYADQTRVVVAIGERLARAARS